MRRYQQQQRASWKCLTRSINAVFENPTNKVSSIKQSVTSVLRTRQAEGNHWFIEEGLGCFIQSTLVQSRILSLLIALVMRRTTDPRRHSQAVSSPLINIIWFLQHGKIKRTSRRAKNLHGITPVRHTNTYIHNNMYTLKGTGLKKTQGWGGIHLFPEVFITSLRPFISLRFYLLLWT